MGLKADFAEPWPGIFSDEGDPAVFTPSVGDPIGCHVFVNINVMLQPAGIEVQVWQRGTTIEALLSEIGREPNRGEIFTVYPDEASRVSETGGADYEVQAILENDGLTVKVVVT